MALHPLQHGLHRRALLFGQRLLISRHLEAKQKEKDDPSAVPWIIDSVLCADGPIEGGCCSEERATTAVESYSPISFLLSKLSSISTLLGSRRKICHRALFGTWFTWYWMPISERWRFVASKPWQPKAT